MEQQLRPTKSSEYLRYEFNQQERMDMGTDLAQSHNRLSAITDEENTMKAQFKERKAAVEMKVNSLSRKLDMGYEMRTVQCSLVYDSPEMNQVSYFREDTGELVRSRAMTKDEAQAPLPFDASPVSDRQAEANTQASEKAATEFFSGKSDEEPDEEMPTPTLEETIGEPEPAAAGASAKRSKRSQIH